MRRRAFLFIINDFVFNIMVYNVHKIYTNYKIANGTTLVHLVRSLGNVR